MARAQTYTDSHYNVFVLCRKDGLIKTLQKCRECDCYISYKIGATGSLLTGYEWLECDWEGGGA